MKGDADITYSHQAVGYSRVELNICIICACLSALRVPLTRTWSTIRKPSPCLTRYPVRVILDSIR